MYGYIVSDPPFNLVVIHGILDPGVGMVPNFLDISPLDFPDK